MTISPIAAHPGWRVVTLKYGTRLEAIEAFPQERYGPFFKMCSNALPSGGRIVA